MGSFSINTPFHRKHLNHDKLDEFGEFLKYASLTARLWFGLGFIHKRPPYQDWKWGITDISDGDVKTINLILTVALQKDGVCLDQTLTPAPAINHTLSFCLDGENISQKNSLLRFCLWEFVINLTLYPSGMCETRSCFWKLFIFWTFHVLMYGFTCSNYCSVYVAFQIYTVILAFKTIFDCLYRFPSLQRLQSLYRFHFLIYLYVEWESNFYDRKVVTKK